MVSIQQILEFELIKIYDYHITIFQIIKIAALYLIIRLLIHVIKSYFKKINLGNTAIDEGRKNSIVQILKYIIYLTFFLLSLQVINVDISILLAGSAALLVGLGFGLQHIFNDLLSGILILFEGNLNTGDIIEIDGIVGTVESVGFRTSKIVTRDSIFIMVPNHKFIQDNVINWTIENKVTRFHVAVGIAYGSDTELVSELLKKCAQDHPKIVKSPKPIARFSNFGDSSLDFELLFWSNDIWAVEDIQSDIRFSIDKIFRENNVEIPFPQRDIHIKSKTE